MNLATNPFNIGNSIRFATNFTFMMIHFFQNIKKINEARKVWYFLHTQKSKLYFEKQTTEDPLGFVHL